MSAVQPERSRGLKLDHVKTAGRVIATVLLPWLTAKFFLKPRLGPLRKDRILDRLVFWRSMVGLAFVVAATYRYQNVWQNTLDKATQTGRLAVILLPLPLFVMLIVTHSGHRVQLLLGALRQLGRGALALTFYYLPAVLLLAAGGTLNVISPGNYDITLQNEIDLNASGTEALWLLAVILLVISLLLWFGCFWYCTIYWAARTGFWLGETHPLLAPIGTTLLMVLITGNEIIGGDTKGVPDPLWLTLNLCGTASALVLSVFEYRHLRSIGYRFRSGPKPVTMG